MDEAIANAALSLRNPFFDLIANGAMWMGSTLQGILLSFIVIAAICLIKRRGIVLLSLIACIFGAAVSSSILKDIIARPRPPVPYAQFEVLGYSMPSSAAAIAIAGLVCMWALKPARFNLQVAYMVILVAVALVVNVSLIYLGAHWFTDVIAGGLLGAIFGLFGLWLTSMIYVRKERSQRSRA